MSTTFAGNMAADVGGSRRLVAATPRALSDQCVAQLTETALEVVLRQGVNRPSVDLEIALWQSLKSAAVGTRQPWTGGIDGLKPDRKSRLATMAEAAYRTALVSGIKGSFIDLEIGLWNAFRNDCAA